MTLSVQFVRLITYVLLGLFGITLLAGIAVLLYDGFNLGEDSPDIAHESNSSEGKQTISGEFSPTGAKFKIDNPTPGSLLAAFGVFGLLVVSFRVTAAVQGADSGAPSSGYRMLCDASATGERVRVSWLGLAVASLLSKKPG